MGETTSYIQIFKKKKIMSPRFMAETAATSGFFRKNSQNKEGIDRITSVMTFLFIAFKEIYMY